MSDHEAADPYKIPIHVFRIDDTNIQLFKDFSCATQVIDQQFEKFIKMEYIQYWLENYCQGFGLKDTQNDQIIGYYTLSATAVQLKGEDIEKFAIRYIPGVLIGQVAIQKAYRGIGWGERLIRIVITFIRKIITPNIGVRFIVIDALPHVVDFYSKTGFDFMYKRESSSPKKFVKMYLDLKKVGGGNH